MAQLKCLSCKCEDLTLHSQHSPSMTGGAGKGVSAFTQRGGAGRESQHPPSMEGAGRESQQHVLVISTLARQRQEDSGWPIGLAKLVSFRFNMRYIIKAME